MRSPYDGIVGHAHSETPPPQELLTVRQIRHRLPFEVKGELPICDRLVRRKSQAPRYNSNQEKIRHPYRMGGLQASTFLSYTAASHGDTRLYMNVCLSRPKTNTIGVPYPASKRSDGHQNHGYFDIKGNPKQLANIVELKNFVEMRSFVRMMNRSASPFRTLGCEKSFSDSELPEFKRKLASYIDVSFEAMEMNSDVANYEVLYKRFEDFAALNPGLLDQGLPGAGGIEFAIGQAFFKDPGVRGWFTSIWIYGYGASDGIARKSWASALSFAHRFFEQET